MRELSGIPHHVPTFYEWRERFVPLTIATPPLPPWSPEWREVEWEDGWPTEGRVPSGEMIVNIWYRDWTAPVELRLKPYKVWLWANRDHPSMALLPPDVPRRVRQLYTKSVQLGLLMGSKHDSVSAARQSWYDYWLSKVRSAYFVSANSEEA